MKHGTAQLPLLPSRPSGSLLKWVGNKFKYSHIITANFPDNYNKYIEPFVGTGAILATLSPTRGIAGDTLRPLIEIWITLQNEPNRLIDYYSVMIDRFNRNREKTYRDILNKYNKSPNGFDLLIISRTCYGGVVRFTKDGKMSTPIGPHNPIPADKFAVRVNEWKRRIGNITFENKSFEYTMAKSKAGDLIYCDPPYIDSQAILYGAQKFSFRQLIDTIHECKKRGAMIALSIDGKKKSGRITVDLKIPEKLFAREIYLDCGSSMLKRFQNGGKIMIGENVHDRLLLTW